MSPGGRIVNQGLEVARGVDCLIADLEVGDVPLPVRAQQSGQSSSVEWPWHRFDAGNLHLAQTPRRDAVDEVECGEAHWPGLIECPFPVGSRVRICLADEVKRTLDRRGLHQVEEAAVWIAQFEVACRRGVAYQHHVTGGAGRIGVGLPAEQAGARRSRVPRMAGERSDRRAAGRVQGRALPKLRAHRGQTDPGTHRQVLPERLQHALHPRAPLVARRRHGGVTR